MEQRSSGALTGAALLLALGVGLAGGLVGKGFRDARQTDRYVTVKGLAEQVVKADVAIWTLQISAGGSDLSKVQSKIDADIAAIREFLTQAGIEAGAIRPQRLEGQDAMAQALKRARTFLKKEPARPSVVNRARRGTGRSAGGSD